MNEDWYKDLSVKRVKSPEGKLLRIEVYLPFAIGNKKNAIVRPGGNEEFLCDIIVGLQHEVDRLEEKARVLDEEPEEEG